MGRMAEIDANLHELPDYEKGVQAERERITALLNKMIEQNTLEGVKADNNIELRDYVVTVAALARFKALVEPDNQ